MIDQHTKLYGVVGDPVGQSLGPVMHNAAFSEKGLNSVYLAFESKDIEGCIMGIKAMGIKGMSITIPYKSSVIGYLNEIDPLADKIGAVNTVVNVDGFLKGYNTDAVGALKALQERADISGKSCLIIGAGGAARAIGFILKESGAQVTVFNRSTERGESLCSHLGCDFIPLNELGNHNSGILINTTPVGMVPDTDRCPVPDSALNREMIVMDIIYNPPETQLIKKARSRGCITINGINMFVHQGAEQFRLWTGLEAPLDAMTKAVKEGIISK